jgi:LuxR family maltose regulon positive regulatory protein
MTDLSHSRASSSGSPLIETKLRAPLLHEGMIPRPELVELVHANHDCKLVLINAPAGYGKTTLLAEWAASERESRSFAWVSLEAADQDPARFWAYVVEALSRIQPGFGGDVRAALTGSVDFEKGVMPQLINELALLPGQVVLVLDDYHVIESRATNELVVFLLDHLADNIQIVVSTRSDPLLPLARLRAHQDMVEIRASQLRFNDEEAATLLHAVLGFELEVKEVEVLCKRTEGWPAGLYLAALSLKDHPHTRQAIEDFAGNNRHIIDYMSEEVLGRQPLEVRRFLTRTSVLEHFNASLCDAVVEREDSAELLRVIEESNLFVVPLDEQREWFRYHHLFAELLRIELQRNERESIPGLHKRAAAWYLRAGDIEHAIRHTLYSKDFRAAGRLIARWWIRFLTATQRATLRSWIAEIPEDDIIDYPPLALVNAWLSAFGGDLTGFERWAEVAENGSYAGSLPDGTTSLESGVAMIRAGTVFGNARQACAAARRAVELEVAPASPWRAVCWMMLGYNLYWVGDLDGSRRMLEKSLWLAQVSPTLPTATLLAMSFLALVEYETGHIGRAEEIARRAISYSNEHGLIQTTEVGVTHVVLGMIHAARDELIEAEKQMERGVALRRVMGKHNGYPHALLAYAPIRQAMGDHDSARALIDEARALIDEYEDPGWLLLSMLGRVEHEIHLVPRRRLEAVQDSSNGGLDPMPLLTDRESAVLKLLSTDLTQRQIADELYLSFNTVKSHKRAIYRKLDVSSRAEAVESARLNGLIG